MRRPALALALSALLVVLPTTGASAAATGGWTHLGNGGAPGTASLNGSVSALNADAPGVLYVGGNFTDAGGLAAADHIATWNGTSWHAVGPSLNGAVHAIAYHAGKVYAGGVFTNAGGNGNADFLAVWDGSHWAPFCTATGPGPAFGGSVGALQIIGSTLYVGGAFQNGAGIAAADYLLACDLNTGASSPTVPNDGDIAGAIYALTADSNGTLYAAGGFINMATIPAADHVASYSGGVWSAMGSGVSPGGGAVTSFVRSMTSNGTDVYIGTDSTDVAGIAKADHVVKWNGSAWSAMGSNTAGSDGWFPASSFIYSMTTSGPLVFAAGSFQNANGDPRADFVAYFDGSAWHSVGSNGAGNGPWLGDGTALDVFHGQVYAGGNFTSAGGDVNARFAASFRILRPDARIGTTAAGPFAGNGVYSPTAAGESKTISVARGSTGTLFVNIQSDGLLDDTFTVLGTGAANGFTVTYFRGATNVTGQVRAGTFSTGNLAPGGNTTLKMVVKLSATSANSGTFPVTAKAGPGTPADAVKAIVKAT